MTICSTDENSARKFSKKGENISCRNAKNPKSIIPVFIENYSEDRSVIN